MKTKSLKNKKPADIIFVIVNTLILGLFTVAILYPIINTVAYSFNDGTDALRGGIYFWPRKFSLKNYQMVFGKELLWTATKISVLRTVIATVSQLFVTSLLAYILSRKEFLFRKQVSFIYVLTMYVSGGLIPTFVLFKNMGLTNSFWVYILPGMVSAFNMIVIRTFMNGLPDSLVESAQVDGAGHFTIFMKIVLPLCKPVLATVALFIAVSQWNSWFDAMLYNRTASNLTTLQYELMKLLSSVMNQGGNAETMKNAANTISPLTMRAATTVITALPIVCLYPFLQKYFVTGMTIGGVKE
nr:carbohydrate ABC transporter permease [uncultured Cellulosilyticum sp.]